MIVEGWRGGGGEICDELVNVALKNANEFDCHGENKPFGEKVWMKQTLDILSYSSLCPHSLTTSIRGRWFVFEHMQRT